jgi:hypothetical protein
LQLCQIIIYLFYFDMFEIIIKVDEIAKNNKELKKSPEEIYFIYLNDLLEKIRKIPFKKYANQF